MEKLHTVHKEKGAGYFALIIIWILLTMAGVTALALFVHFLLAVLVLIICGLILFFAFIKADYDYDYNYFNGVLVFARVRNKSSRKVLGKYDLDKAITIAPKGDRSIYKYEKDANITHKNYCSFKEAQNVYAFIGKNDKDMIIHIEFEGEDEFLTAIWDKYSQIMVYKPGDVEKNEISA